MGATYIAAASLAIIIIAAAYMRKKEVAKSNFLSAMRYRPLFIDPLGEGRNNSRGYTTGAMPSIDTEAEGDWMCCGALGVPP